MHLIIYDKDKYKYILKLTHNLTKENSLPVFNVYGNESHSSLKLSNHCDANPHDPGESIPKVEDSKNSFAVKTKRKKNMKM